MIIDNFYRGDYDFLTNFAPAIIKYHDIIYPTTEHAYQAAKSSSTPEKLFVSRLETPGDAKKYCRRQMRYFMGREQWDQIKDDVMEDVLRLKFAPRSIMAERLIETGDAWLVEGNDWHDNYWGECHCFNCCVRLTNGEFSRTNMLGFLLTKIRSELSLDREITIHV